MMKTLKILALITLALLAMGYGAHAQKVTVDNVIYKIDKKNGTAELDNGKNALGHLVIPETVTFEGKEYKVTSIGKYAFCPGMSVKNENLTGIIIPNSITTIKAGAFDRCQKLREVFIPNSVTEISRTAFWNCTSLQSIVVPDNEPHLRSASAQVFFGCTAINSVRGNSVPYPQYVYNCNDWLDSDCPFMKYTYPKLAANGFQEPKEEPAIAQQVVPVKENNTAPTTITIPQSDVDKNIPQNAATNENTFAVVIANENYQEVSKVPCAINDGTIFAEYCQKSLGLPATNVHLVTDATFINMRREVNWLKQVANTYKGEARILVYYAGHGIPDEATQTSYLLPIDGLGNDVSTGLSLKEFYKTLSEIPSKSVMVFLDACFSGATRDGGMMAAARGVAIKAKPETPQGQLVVFSAAQGDETAYPYTENGHGMFTYYLLKKIQQTKGEVTLGELSDYVTDNVVKKSIVVNGKSQTPTISSSATLGEDWKSWKLR